MRSISPNTLPRCDIYVSIPPAYPGSISSVASLRTELADAYSQFKHVTRSDELHDKSRRTVQDPSVPTMDLQATAGCTLSMVKDSMLTEERSSGSRTTNSSVIRSSPCRLKTTAGDEVARARGGSQNWHCDGSSGTDRGFPVAVAKWIVREARMRDQRAKTTRVGSTATSFLSWIQL
ncbi:hypothetical protein K438DRAFT_1783860 [Mycena galopus ATCC 62051]|nr:hypothetical protein K438DRAFT_1783860 [Mycena galopus ATCC 62051]